MDAAGKDGTIKHVMSGVNPQGCQVYSFKVAIGRGARPRFPLAHVKCLPERGRIGIFNRSYYEEVLVVRVHPEFLGAQKLPPALLDKNSGRSASRTSTPSSATSRATATLVLKFFLNVSKKEQKKRFLERLDKPEKNWKFSTSDAKERGSGTTT